MSALVNTVLCQYNRDIKKATGEVLSDRAGGPRYGVHSFKIVQTSVKLLATKNVSAYLACNLLTQYQNSPTEEVIICRSPIHLLELVGNRNQVKVFSASADNFFLVEGLGRIEFELKTVNSDRPVEDVEFDVLLAYRQV